MRLVAFVPCGPMVGRRRDAAWLERDESTRRLGSSLVAVLVVSILSSMLAVALLYRMDAEIRGADAGLAREKAWAAAMSGIQVAAAVAEAHVDEPDAWLDRPEIFRSQVVGDDGVDRWCFTVYAASADVRAPLRFGIEDCSALFNVHMIRPEILAAMPLLDSAISDGILDAIDADSLARPLGAENEVYAATSPPYSIRDGRLRSLEELLLVRGMDLDRLHGEDRNDNWRLDPEEDDGPSTPPVDDGDGVLDRGLESWLTVWGVGWAVDRERRPQVDLNVDVDALASLALPESAFRFIAERRQQHAQSGSTDLAISHPSELLGARISKRAQEGIPSSDGSRSTPEGADEVIESGIEPVHLPELLDRTRTYPFERFISQHVNVNTASAEVLAKVPGIDDSLASAIVAKRSEIPAATRRTSAWLLEEGLVDTVRYVAIAPWLTTRGYQYRFRVVGYAVPSGHHRILEAIIDVGHPLPRIVALRDVTRSGLSFSLFDEVSEEPNA
jgi:hypothetical protein